MKRGVWIAAILVNLVFSSICMAFPHLEGTYTGTLLLVSEHNNVSNELMVIEVNKQTRNVIKGTVIFQGFESTFTGLVSRTSVQIVTDYGSIDASYADNDSLFLSVKWNNVRAQGVISKLCQECSK